MAGPDLPEEITAGVTTGHVGHHERIHDLLNEFDMAAQAGTKGDLLVVDGGLIRALPVGDNGQVLTADSAETLGVKWAAGGGGGGGGGGGLVFVEEVSLVSGVFEYTLGAEYSPDWLELQLSEITVNTDGTAVSMEIKTNGTWRTSSYHYAVSHHSTSGTTNNSQAASAASVLLQPTGTWGIGTGSPKAFNATMRIWTPAVAKRHRGFWEGHQDFQTTNSGRVIGGWEWTGGTDPIEAVRFAGASGALNGGKLLVWGAER
jgi:hypothetical protein